MLTIEAIRKIDPNLNNTDTDEELLQAREALYDVAQLAFEVWNYRRTGSKNPVGLLTPDEVNDTI